LLPYSEKFEVSLLWLGNSRFIIPLKQVFLKKQFLNTASPDPHRNT
jgi:hypothetical protein